MEADWIQEADGTWQGCISDKLDDTVRETIKSESVNTERQNHCYIGARPERVETGFSIGNAGLFFNYA